MGRRRRGHWQLRTWHNPPPRPATRARPTLGGTSGPRSHYSRNLRSARKPNRRLDAAPRLQLVHRRRVSLAITDLTVRRLPNALIIPTYPAILALFCIDAATSHSTTSLVRSAASMMATLLTFTALYALAPGQLGGGDVKLSGLVGLVLGWFSETAAFTGILLAWLLAAFAGVALRLSRKSQPEGLPLETFLVVASITTALANI